MNHEIIVRVSVLLHFAFAIAMYILCATMMCVCAWVCVRVHAYV